MSQVEGRSNILIQDETGGLKSVAKRAEEIFGKLDADNDRELTIEEFVNGYMKLNSHQKDGLGGTAGAGGGLSGPVGKSKGARKSSRRGGRKFWKVMEWVEQVKKSKQT